MWVLKVPNFCHHIYIFSGMILKGRRGWGHPAIWIHSREELYKTLTILPGAKLELDAVRINW